MTLHSLILIPSSEHYQLSVSEKILIVLYFLFQVTMAVFWVSTKLDGQSSRTYAIGSTIVFIQEPEKCTIGLFCL